MESMRENMKSYKITYKVKESPKRAWSLRYMIIRAYTHAEAKSRFTLWEGLIVKIEAI